MAHLSNYYFRLFPVFALHMKWPRSRPRICSSSEPLKWSEARETPGGSVWSEGHAAGLLHWRSIYATYDNVPATANGAKSNAFCVKLIIRLTWPLKRPLKTWLKRGNNGPKQRHRKYMQKYVYQILCAPGAVPKKPSGFYMYIYILFFFLPGFFTCKLLCCKCLYVAPLSGRINLWFIKDALITTQPPHGPHAAGQARHRLMLTDVS